LLILKVGHGPEAEVHEVKHEQLQESPLNLLAGFVKSILVEVFECRVFISKLEEFVFIDFDMLCLRVNPSACLSNQLATIWQHKK